MNEEYKPLMNVVKYLEMKAFSDGHTNLTAGLRFVQLLIPNNDDCEISEEKKSMKSVEDAFVKLKEELMTSGWK